MAIRLRLSRIEETSTGPAARRALLTVAVCLLAWSSSGIRGAQAQTVPTPAPAGAPVPAAATAMTAEARAHYDRGLALYAAKNYAAAIQELEAGYALDPRREFLFAEAQAQRLAGDCQRAVPLYQRFLATEPSALQASAAQVGLARCAQQMATATPPPGSAGSSPTGPPTVPPPAPPAPATPPPQAWYRDPVGGALLGAGIIGLGVGAGFLIGSLAASNNATTYDDYSGRRATIERRWNIGVVGLTSGALLTGTALYRYHSLPTSTSTSMSISSATIIGATVAPGYGGLLLQGQF